MIKNKRLAFSLAEVLITLSIIGIVATMTIPALINNIQDSQYKTAYKKAYSTLTQAFQRAVGENEITPLSGTYASIGGDANFAKIKSYFSVVKDCPASTKSALSECWDPNGEIFYVSKSYDIAPAFIDKSGMTWRMRAPDNMSLFPLIFVDTNGATKPNKYGQDRFVFVFYPDNSSGLNVTINPNDVWSSYSVLWYSSGYTPVKIMPFGDVTNSSGYNLEMCPSLAKHPCYYTSWLYN